MQQAAITEMLDTAQLMSQANLDAVRRWIDAYNRRDLDGLLELTDRDIEFRSVLVRIEPVFRGHEGIHVYFEALGEAYDAHDLLPSEFIDAGAAVVVIEHVDWRGKESGAEGRSHNAPVMWLMAGKVFRIETFENRAQALEAVGLTEQEARAGSAAP
jgi:ketosteroid isomerase-like protein